MSFFTGKIGIALGTRFALQEGKENGSLVGCKWRLLTMMCAYFRRRNEQRVIEQQTYRLMSLGHADMMQHRVLFQISFLQETQRAFLTTEGLISLVNMLVQMHKVVLNTQLIDFSFVGEVKDLRSTID